jgi:hypothetical protein
MEALQDGPLKTWLMDLPADSLKRLKAINASTGSSRHIILSLTYGIYDSHIRKLNGMITGLLIARLRAERAGNSNLVHRINRFMHNVHEAVDLATGVNSKSIDNGNVCGRAILH